MCVATARKITLSCQRAAGGARNGDGIHGWPMCGERAQVKLRSDYHLCYNDLCCVGCDGCMAKCVVAIAAEEAGA